MQHSLADRPKRAAAERAKPGIKAGVAREAAFKRAVAKIAKANKSRSKARSRQNGNKNRSHQQWKNAGCGRDLDTGEYAGGTEVDGEEVVDAPTSVINKYQDIANTAQCGIGDSASAIVSAMTKKGADLVPVGTKNHLELEFNAHLRIVELNHEAESRINAIYHNALDKSGETHYKIERVGGGVLTADGGHVLGRKEDYDQGNIDKPPLEEKQFMNEEFKDLCESLKIIGAPHPPEIIMEAKITFKDMIQRNRALVDHCYIIDYATCILVLKGTYDLLGKHMCQTVELAKHCWLLWSIVWHCESQGWSGSFGYLLQKVAPDKDWEFLSVRDRTPSLKCIENQRQKEMTAGGRNKLLGKGGSGKRKQEENWNREQDMKKRNGVDAKGTNNKEDTEQEKRDKKRQLALRAAEATGLVKSKNEGLMGCLEK